MTDQTKTYRNPNLDRTGWGPGPWDDEPDKLSWVDDATGLDCLIVRNRYGALCGYVGVPPGHRDYGITYDEVPVDVHGGLTYAHRCQDGPENQAICHVAAPGRPDDVWWLGFDCSHASDLAPGMVALDRRLGLDLLGDCRETYRDVGYVRREVADLAAQLARRP